MQSPLKVLSLGSCPEVSHPWWELEKGPLQKCSHEAHAGNQDFMFLPSPVSCLLCGVSGSHIHFCLGTSLTLGVGLRSRLPCRASCTCSCTIRLNANQVMNWKPLQKRQGPPGREQLQQGACPHRVYSQCGETDSEPQKPKMDTNSSHALKHTETEWLQGIQGLNSGPRR